MPPAETRTQPQRCSRLRNVTFLLTHQLLIFVTAQQNHSTPQTRRHDLITRTKKAVKRQSGSRPAQQADREVRCRLPARRAAASLSALDCPGEAAPARRGTHAGTGGPRALSRAASPRPSRPPPPPQNPAGPRAGSTRAPTLPLTRLPPRPAPRRALTVRYDTGGEDASRPMAAQPGRLTHQQRWRRRRRAALRMDLRGAGPRGRGRAGGRRGAQVAGEGRAGVAEVTVLRRARASHGVVKSKLK